MTNTKTPPTAHTLTVPAGNWTGRQLTFTAYLDPASDSFTLYVDGETYTVVVDTDLGGEAHAELLNDSGARIATGYYYGGEITVDGYGVERSEAIADVGDRTTRALATATAFARLLAAI